MRTLQELFDLCLSADYQQCGDTNYAVLREGNDVTLLFEHSRGEADWRRNLRFCRQRYTVTSSVGYRVHRGLLEAWEAVLPCLRKVLDDKTIRSVTVVGYSHGAGLTVICHDYLWFFRPELREKLHSFAFAPPRVVAFSFSDEWSADRFFGLTTICNRGDLVTMLPPAFLGYTHVGRRLNVGKWGRYGPLKAHRAENYRKELARLGL